jgi:hypothetical protein
MTADLVQVSKPLDNQVITGRISPVFVRNWRCSFSKPNRARTPAPVELCVQALAHYRLQSSAPRIKCP